MKRFGLMALRFILVFALVIVACNGSTVYTAQAVGSGSDSDVMGRESESGIEVLADEADEPDDAGTPVEIDLGAISLWDDGPEAGGASSNQADDAGIPLEFLIDQDDLPEDEPNAGSYEEMEAVSNATATQSSGLIFNVCDFGAVPDDDEDDRAAFNAALEMALQSTEAITVVIPAGKYILSNGIFVYSDTNIVADADATIVSNKVNGSIVYAAHLDETGARCSGCMLGGDYCADHGFGYTKTKNVTIEGGTWACPTGDSVMSTTVFAFRHSNNIVIKNLTCKNASGHMINLSGTNMATVSNVTFLNAKKSDASTDYWGEAIHLDYCSEEGEPTSGTPYDNTPAKNITIEGCTFNNVHAGVGNHHVRPKGATISSNIIVQNCTFKNIEAYALANRSIDGLKILDNTAYNVGVFAYITDSSNVTIKGNSFNAKGGHAYDSISGSGNNGRAAIDIRTTNPKQETGDAQDFERPLKEYALVNTITVSDNTILNAVFGGITVYGYDLNNLDTCKSVTVSNNTVKDCGGVGIAVQNTKEVTVKSNKVLSAKSHGVFVQTSKGVVISGNTVTIPGGNALYVMGVKTSPCTARILKNVLDSKEGVDLFLSNYAEECYLSGNKLKNYGYREAKTASFTGTIDLPKLAKATLEKTTYPYTGKAYKLKPTVTDTVGRVLTEGTDYKLAYSSCTNAGEDTATVRVIGYGCVFGGQEIRTTFTITPKRVRNVKVTLSKTSYVYSGKSRKPAVNVSIGTTVLTSANYKATYPSGRTNAGTYKVTVNLKGNYAGSGSASFTIQKASNPMVVTNKKLTQSITKNTTKDTTIKLTNCLTVSKAVGTVSYKKSAGSKYITVNSKTGKLTVSKDTPKSTQTVKVQITAAGNTNYKEKTLTRIIKIKVE